MSRERHLENKERLPVEEVARLFKGLVLPSVTILNPDLQIDVEAQTRLGVETSWQVDVELYGGTSGMGNNPFFTLDMLKTSVEVGVRVREKVGRGLHTQDPLLVVCGAYGQTAEKAAEFARVGIRTGANAVVSPTPYCGYNPQTAEIKLPSDIKEMHEYTWEYYDKFARRLGNEVALAAYNMPGASWKEYSMPAWLVGEILNNPTIIGVKDSSRNGLLTQQYCDVAHEITKTKGTVKRVFSGFFPTIGGLQKADGGVPIEANLLRLIPLVTWQAALAQEFDVAQKAQVVAQKFLDEVVGGLEKDGFPFLAAGPNFYLAQCGLGGGYVLPGLSPVDDPRLQRQIIEAKRIYEDEKQLLVTAGVPEQYIREAEEIIAERKARAGKNNLL